MRAIQWLCFITLFAVMFCFAVLTANGQTLRGDALGLRPTSMPATCNTGDVRIDSADGYKLKICESNVWATSTANDNVMTAVGDIIIGGAAGVQTRLGIGTLSHVLQVSPSGAPAYGFVTNGNVDASAGIVDTKLATISTALKVSNSATTAASANTASAIVARDVSGNFVAGTITAALTGNSSTATALASDPSDCASDTYANAIATNGNLTCASITNAATTGTASNTNSTLVLRDVSGNFAAGTVTAALTGNASTATALASNPTDCASDTYANAIAASGNLTCATVTNAGLAGSIAASKLVGTDIATVGTVTSGTWSATEIDETKGGTGLTSYAAGDSIYATGSNTLGKVGIGASGQVWTVTGASTMGWTTPLGVNARYASTSGNSIGNGSIDIIDFATADYDASSAVTTGGSWKFTVPAGQGGKYRVSAAVVFASQAWSAGNLISLYLYINGNPASRLGGKQLDANITARQTVDGTDTISLAAGDYVDVRGEHGESAARTLTTTGGDNHVSIERVGN